MKKIVCLSLVAVLLFTLSFSCFAASGVVISYAKDAVLSFVSSTILSYSNSIQQRTEAARGAYFNYIVEDKLCSGLTIFDSSGKKFTDDILEYYFNYYLEAVTGTSDYYDSDYDVFIQAAGFPNTPFSLRLLSFYFSYDTSSDSIKSEFISSSKTLFKNYYNSFLARYLIAQGETATDPNPGKSGLDIAPGYVSSEELVEGIEKDNSYYTPKGELGKISYRTDDTFQKYVNFPSTARTSFYMPYIIDNNRFVSSGGSEEMYFLFFFQDDTNEYISEFQFRLYFEVKTNYDDSGSVTSVEKYPRLQMWSNIDGSISEPIEFLDSTVDCSDYKYFSIDIYNSSSAFRIVGYKTFTDFLNATNKNFWSKFYFTGNYDKLYLPDFSGSTQYSTQISGISSHTFMGSYDYHTSKSCKYNDNCDIGLYVSPTPIYFTYRDIDTTKIPSNQIITINGDTIYNYTITNPETGDSSKFGDYITNNYTYITNNYGGSESGGSSGSGVSGNVTVGGSIDVGGSVGVDITVSVPDININVNGNGGAGGSGSSIANPDDFTSADEVDLTKYYDEAVEQSTGFQKFLKDFLGFLPAELLGLILFAVGMAIVCRVFGR